VENPHQLKPSELFDLLKLAFALIGGIGDAVALVVAHRTQKVHEQENYRAKAAERREDAKVAEDNRRTAAAETRENTKLLNERFGAASAQLGHEKAAVRLAPASCFSLRRQPHSRKLIRASANETRWGGD